MESGGFDLCLWSTSAHIAYVCSRVRACVGHCLSGSVPSSGTLHRGFIVDIFLSLDDDANKETPEARHFNS